MAELLLLDPIGGIAGDMFLAMAIDLGVPVADLSRGLGALGLAGWRLVVQRTSRHAIGATHVKVAIDEPELHTHRAWAEIRRLIAGSGLPPPVRDRALAIFERVAEAEARVHGTPVDEVEFHELGAVDSIVDTVGAALAVELLGNPEIWCATPPLGSGEVRSAHGVMPVPPPAVVEILKGRRVRFEGVGELTTPTGAAIIAALTREGPWPEMAIDRVGYGAGTRDTADRPNLLRGILGRRATASDAATWVLEANLDDATPQLLAWTVERLMAEGALDAWVAPVTMKKGRPGHVLGALATAETRARLGDLVLRETPTLGVRAFAVERRILERRFESVETPWGAVQVKVGSLGGADVNAAPEYEDCARLARQNGVPLKDVMAAALAALARRR